MAPTTATARSRVSWSMVAGSLPPGPSRCKRDGRRGTITPCPRPTYAHPENPAADPSIRHKSRSILDLERKSPSDGLGHGPCIARASNRGECEGGPGGGTGGIGVAANAYPDSYTRATRKVVPSS